MKIRPRNTLCLIVVGALNNKTWISRRLFVFQMFNRNGFDICNFADIFNDKFNASLIFNFGKNHLIRFFEDKMNNSFGSYFVHPKKTICNKNVLNVKH